MEQLSSIRQQTRHFQKNVGYPLSFYSQFSFFLGFSPQKKNLLANKTRDNRLYIGSKKSELYYWVVQGKNNHLNWSFCNNWHPITIVNHIHNPNNEAQLESCSSLTIFLIFQAGCMLQARKKRYHSRYFKPSCKR